MGTWRGRGGGGEEPMFTLLCPRGGDWLGGPLLPLAGSSFLAGPKFRRLAYFSTDFR